MTASLCMRWYQTFQRTALHGRFIASVVTLLLLMGCSDQPEIRQYRIAGEVPKPLITRDRMLVAMVPQEQDVWFLKLMGPETAVTSVAPQFEKFVKSLKFKDGSPDLSQAPRAWNDGGNKPMRFKTFLIDTPEVQLDLSISSLPRSGEWDDQVSMNVNRWRGQLQLPPSEESWAGATKLELAAAPQPSAWVDISGEQGESGMMPPNMGAMANATGGPGMGGPMTGGSSDPAGSGSADPSAAQDDSPLDYQLPDGWVVGEKKMMRLASFQIGTADAPAELTVIPAGGDVRGNVARWLGQIRTTPPSDEDIDKALQAAEQRKVFNRDSTRYQLTSDKDGDDVMAIDATIVPLEDGYSLFIKATGPRKVLADQRERIGQFLDSLKLK